MVSKMFGLHKRLSWVGLMERGERRNERSEHVVRESARLWLKAELWSSWNHVEKRGIKREEWEIRQDLTKMCV